MAFFTAFTPQKRGCRLRSLPNFKLYTKLTIHGRDKTIKLINKTTLCHFIVCASLAIYTNSISNRFGPFYAVNHLKVSFWGIYYEKKFLTNLKIHVRICARGQKVNAHRCELEKTQELNLTATIAALRETNSTICGKKHP